MQLDSASPSIALCSKMYIPRNIENKSMYWELFRRFRDRHYDLSMMLERLVVETLETLSFRIRGRAMTGLNIQLLHRKVVSKMVHTGER